MTIPTKNQFSSLTAKEQKVLNLALQGYNNAEIAKILDISISTVKTHKNHLISKLGLEGKGEFQKFLWKNAKTPP